MHALRDQYPVRLLCDLVGLAPSSYYYRSRAAPQRALRAAVEEVAGAWPTYGVRRVTHQLRRAGWTVGIKRVRRLMREAGLLVAPRRARGQGTQRAAEAGGYPNRVKGVAITHPDQVWVADITYVRLRAQFVYLAIVMDVFTRQLRGWHLARAPDTALSLSALERALEAGVPRIHHSDQGVQYTCPRYLAALETHAIAVSLAAVGAPHENGFAERVIRTIKEEEVDLSDYATFAEAYQQLGQFIDQVYRYKRIHSALGYITPAEFEQQWREQQSCP